MDQDLTLQDNPSYNLDLQGVYCPEVVLRVRAFIESMPEGAALNVISTDPLSVIDLRLFAMKAGHTLEHHSVEDKLFRFVLIRRA